MPLTFISHFVWGVVVSLSFVVTTQGQTPASSNAPALEEAQKFVAQLKREPAADAMLFQATGQDQALKLMLLVVHAGASPDATLTDWANTHLALDGLIELETLRGDTRQASQYLVYQEALYNAYEGDAQKALQTARALASYESEHGKEQLLPLAYKAIGDDLQRLGKHKEAIAEFHKAEKRAPSMGSAALKAGYTEGWVGNLWLDTVKAEIELPDLEAAQHEASKFQQRVPVGAPLLLAKAQIAEAAVALAEGKYDAALAGVKQACALVHDPAEKESVNLDAAVIVATVLQDTIGKLDYSEAIATAKQIAAEFADLKLGVEAMARTSVLIRRRLAGDLDGVLRELTAELDEARAADDNLAQIAALQSLAGTYAASLSTDNQIAALEEAANLARAGLHVKAGASNIAVEAYLEVLNQLGWAYTEAGQVAKAATTYQELTRQLATIQRARLRLYADRHVAADALQGQARVLELQGKQTEAREILQGVLTGKTRLTKFDRADFLLQLARLERDAGQPSPAAAAYETLIAARQEERDGSGELSARLEYSRYLLTSPNALSGIPDALQKARAQLDAASQVTEKINAAYAEWRLKYQYGLLAEARREDRLAVEDYERAVTRLDKIRDSLSQSEQRESLFGDEAVQDLYQRLIALLARAGQSSEAWRYLEKFKARSFTEMMGQRRIALTSSSSPELRQLADLEKKILDLRVQLAPENRASLTRGGGDPARLNAELKNLELQFGLARQEKSLAETRSGSEIAAEPVSLAALQKLIPSGTTVLEYGLLNDEVIAFLVTRTTTRELHWKLDMAALQAKVSKDLRPSLADASSGPELKGMIDDVSRMLIEPIAKSLPRTNPRLLVVPSGYLNYIPFQVLHTPEGHALIDQFTISYLPSASTLQFLAPFKAARPPTLFVGAIGDIRVESLKELPGTLAEAEAIARLDPWAKTAVGVAFTHDAAREALLKNDIVHFATHGVIDPVAPLFSALLTSPTERQPSRLSLYEIPDLNVRARLVVLSACQSGGGLVIRGDEVSGFTRTFLLAGAENVVASLWDISDQSTAELMKDFYSHMGSGQTPAEALRASSLAIRKQFPHPKYWAAFVVTGLP